MMLKKEEVDEDLIRGAKIFHFGTLSSTHEGVREATRYAIDVAKATKQIVMQNIVIALGIKSVFLILGALGIAGMWEAVFGDVGVTIIAVLNAMRILKK